MNCRKQVLVSGLKERAERKFSSDLNGRNIFKDERGAIDLTSIMVGIIVIGLIGGVIAATVFIVIPWTQDNAAKQQLDSVVAAQSAYKGLSSNPSGGLPEGHPQNSYGDSSLLESASLLTADTEKYCTIRTSGGQGYEAYSLSSSGKIWRIKDTATSPELYTGEFTSACYSDPEPQTTRMTYQCDYAMAGTLPMMGNVNGKLSITGSDGSQTDSQLSGAQSSELIQMNAGVSYIVTLEGTYQSLSSSESDIASCLRSLDHWGTETRVESAASGLASATKLESVPAHIPPTVTDLSGFFYEARTFNHSNIKLWNVTNVTKMNNMFQFASSFNQDISGWNVSNVTEMDSMFSFTDWFNQPIGQWDTGNVITMKRMFANADKFNQPLNSWNASKVTNMNSMFYQAPQFNGPIDAWDTKAVTDMNEMFYGAAAFNWDISGWVTHENVTHTDFRTGSGLAEDRSPF